MPLTHRIESNVANTPVNAYLVEGERGLVAIVPDSLSQRATSERLRSDT